MNRIMENTLSDEGSLKCIFLLKKVYLHHNSAFSNAFTRKNKDTEAKYLLQTACSMVSTT
jgi:hypothetical protein